MDIKEFYALPVMGILRGIKPGDIGPLFEAVISAGLKTIEITMNTPDAAQIIKEALKTAEGRMSIGAGTVLTMKDLNAALDAGVQFIVMPVFSEDIVKVCVKEKIPVFPGAFTPGEVYKAWDAGAAMVKVFPANAIGPKYIEALKGPFNDIKILAVGGIGIDNVSEYFSAGADAVAFGGGVFKKEWIDNKDLSSIGDLVKRYIEKVISLSADQDIYLLS